MTASGGFDTLLFASGRSTPETEADGDRSFASDLNLDQVAETMAEGWEEPDLLRSLFFRRPDPPDTVTFRQAVFGDLENEALFRQVMAFGESLHRVRTHLRALGKMRSAPQRHGWHLDAVAIYCDAVRTLAEQLRAAPLRSAGMADFAQELDTYTASGPFATMERETADRRAALTAVRYCVRIHGSRVEVSRYDGEADYSAEVLKTFDRFKQGAVKDYRVAYGGWPGMHHVGEQILDLVAKLFPEEFSALEEYCARHRDFYHPAVRRFEREVQFYLAYLDYIRPLRSAGLQFCYPEVGPQKEVEVSDTFDLALARKLVGQGTSVVVNDVRVTGAERVLVVTGPNQGGKTTFARTFGQLHHLAALGCPVPGSSARLARFDRLFTHFGKEEDLGTMVGKLEEDLVRIRAILLAATPRSIVIMNEAFSSTALHDATFLGTKALQRIVELDLLAVYVTFVDELASLGPSVVSMVSTIVPDNPAERTFKVVRGPANGLAYAVAIAEKYGLTYRQLHQRLGS